MAQDVAFGHRVGLAGDGASEPPSDVHIEMQLGFKLLPTLGYLLGAFALQLLPLLFGASIQDLVHSSTGWLLGGSVALTFVVWAWTRQIGRLDVDADGVAVTSDSGAYFYGWRDIERIEAAKGAVRLYLRGRSSDQNAYNLVSARFARNAGDLQALLAAGLERHRGAAGSRRPSVAPGDDLRRARLREWGTVAGITSFAFGAAFIALLTWAALDCQKTLDLQRYGRAEEAKVVRIYLSGCGRRSCSLRAEFSYLADDGKSYTGYGQLATSDDKQNPDLLYAQSQGAVPIVYDTTNPRRVSLNFGNGVFQDDAVGGMLNLIKILGGITLAMYLLIMGAMSPPLWKALLERPSAPTWTQGVRFDRR